MTTADPRRLRTEKIWAWCDELGLPRVGFVTRMDRERASFDEALAAYDIGGAMCFTNPGRSEISASQRAMLGCFGLVTPSTPNQRQVRSGRADPRRMSRRR